MSAPTKDLSPFFAPKSVAIVGAGERPTSSGGAVLQNLQRAGYTGKIIPVNPKGGKIHGLPVVKSIADLTEPVELVIVLVRPDLIPDIVRDAAATGHRNMMILPGGFKEAGQDGVEREKLVAKIADDAGIIIAGPNSAGIMNVTGGQRFAASFLRALPAGGGMALISQSGALSEEVVAASHVMNLQFGTIVSVGNALHLGVEDYLEYLGGQDDCTAAILYFESVADEARLKRVAREVAAKKPVIALTPGRTDAGREAAKAHTGSYPMEASAMAAFCEDAGIVQVKSLHELLIATKTFGMYPTGIGDRILLISNSGGPGVLATDRAVLNGLSMPNLPDAMRQAIAATVPPEASLANPLDLLADAREDRFGVSLESALGSDGDAYDAILMIHVVPFMVDADPVVDRLAALAKGTNKPVFHSMIGTLPGKKEWFAKMEEAGVPMFNNVEDMADAAGILAAYNRIRAKLT